MSFLKAQVSFCPNFATLSIVMKYKSSVLFWLKNYIIWSKTAQENVNFFRLKCSSQNYQIPYVTSQTTSQFPSDFSLFFRVITHLQIFSSFILHFGQKDPMKVPILALFFWCSDENQPNSLYHFLNHKSVFLSFQVKHTLCIKGTSQRANFLDF